MKWVTATDLQNWAATVSARYALSELVANLVRATAKSQTAFRFPTRDSAHLPGYDGLLEAEECPPYIPGGLSVWEFGTAQDAKEKAIDDYRKRTENPRSVRPEDTTFVLVTTRSFPDPQQWIQDRLNEGGRWRAVKVIDAVALEDWLERCPAVALSFGQSIGKLPQSGVQSVAELWADYAGRTDPPLKEEVLLAGRSEQAQELLESLSSGDEQSIVVRADSRDEALAFTLAVLRKAPEDLSKYLDSRTVIVDDTTIARLVAGHGHLILGLRSFSTQPSMALLQGGNIVVVPQGNDALRQHATLTLSRPTRYEFAEALTIMGLDQEGAERLAWECGRSVTVLQRRRPAITYPVPDWVRDNAAREVLIPALLAGAWDSKSDADRKVLERLSRQSYKDFERGLRAYVNIESPPIECTRNVWTLVAPVDSFALLAPVDQQDLDLLQAVAIEVFSEIDPRLDMPPAERPYAAIHGKTLKHSNWLREGLAGTLLLVSVLGEHLDLTTTKGAQIYVNELISALPELRNNYRLIASLEGQLPLLMEAAPDPFLNALEHLIEGDGQAIAGIFQKSDLLWPSSTHTNLLWALEMLAWDPSYLTRVTLILGGLARLDPGGRLLNRPINSLRAIYLPWLPSTNAPLVVRMRALDRLTKAEPEVGWDLLVRLLPKHSDMADPTHRPRWREYGASEKEVVTQAIVDAGYEEVVRRAIDSLGIDAERWKLTFQDMSTFTEDERTRVYEKLVEFARGQAHAEDKAVVWEALRTLLREHRRFASAAWALPTEDLDRLDQILGELRPEDLVQQNLWLFEQYHPDVPVDEGEDDFEAANRFRSQALASIINAEGSWGVLRLAGKSRFPAMVGATAGSILETDPLDDLLDQAWSEDQKLKDFTTGLSARASRVRGTEWTLHIVSRAAEEQWEAERIVAMLLGFSDERTTWNIVESFGSEVERMYWERRNDWPRNASREDLEFVAVKYAELGRATQALDTLFDRSKGLSSRSLIALLDKAFVEVNTREVLPQSFGWLRDTFEELSRRDDIEFMELARREYQWLPLLEHHGDVAALHKFLQESPEFFAEVICDRYRAHSEPKSDEEITEERKVRAENGYRLLRSWKSLPGAHAGEISEREVLQDWIRKARSLAAELDRAAVADIHIGQLLAYAPSDPDDDAWPHRIIRDMLEELDAPEIEQGIRTEQFNKRGVSRKAAFEGGDQERGLASRARSWAAACAAWPRTHRLLEEIAASWERMARREDDSAELDKRR